MLAEVSETACSPRIHYLDEVTESLISKGVLFKGSQEGFGEGEMMMTSETSLTKRLYLVEPSLR